MEPKRILEKTRNKKIIKNSLWFAHAPMLDLTKSSKELGDEHVRRLN